MKLPPAENVNFEGLPLLGRGEFGKAWLLQEGFVLKVTSSEAEYEAALRLMQEQPQWSCRIFDARPEGKLFWLLKEKLELPQYKEAGIRQDFPGHLWGIVQQKGEWEGLATRPCELCQGLFVRAEGKPQPALRKRFTAAQLQSLASAYADDEQRRCFLWLMETYWTVTDAGFEGRDLWCNFGMRPDGTFAYFDLELRRNA